MASEKYLMINVDDERAKNLADVLGNKTSRIKFVIQKDSHAPMGLGMTMLVI